MQLKKSFMKSSREFRNVISSTDGEMIYIYLIRPCPFFLHLNATKARSSAIPLKFSFVGEKGHINSPSPIHKAQTLLGNNCG